MHIYAFLYVCVSVCKDIFLCVHTYTRVYVHMYTCIYVYVYLNICVYIFTDVHMCIRIRTEVCIYIYIHTHIFILIQVLLYSKDVRCSHVMQTYVEHDALCSNVKTQNLVHFLCFVSHMCVCMCVFCLCMWSIHTHIMNIYFILTCARTLIHFWFTHTCTHTHIY